jgi:U4/U6.U5 tri-snRNP-associated protein 1
MDISEVRIKKPKKKKTKSTRQKPIDEDDMIPSARTEILLDDKESMMDVDVPTVPAKKRNFQEASLVDDDELQASLTRQRIGALKKRKRVKPEDIAKQLLEESPATHASDNEDNIGLVIDETSEFVANLQKPSALEQNRRPASQLERAKTSVEPYSDEEGDVDMDRSYADIKDEEDPEDRQRRGSTVTPEVTSTGLEEEVTLDKGLGSTLRLLKERGIIQSTETGDLNAVYRDRQKFLAEKRRREEAAELKARQQRERDRATGRLDRMTAREKEEYARLQNNYRDQQESRLLSEHFNKEYKPNVELKYVDEFGRHMNQKEAFKHLSHQFHGKGSGKQKTEKMLKKIEDEKKRAAQSSLDASQIVGISGAAGQQSKKQKQAGVRLA